MPIWISSPSLSPAVSTRSRLTNVPLRLPWSSIFQRSPSFVKTACLRETVTSSRKIAHSGERPIVVGLSSSGNVSPARPPPERTMRRRAVDAEIVERVEALRHLGSGERLGRLAFLGDDERRAALRAEVRSFRVVVPALGAVDVRHQAGGAALPVRISVSESTSTESRTLLPSRLLQPGDELGPQDVDLPVQEPPAVRHLLLLARQLVDELLQVVVGQCRKIRQRFHQALSYWRVKLNFSLCPRMEQRPPRCGPRRPRPARSRRRALAARARARPTPRASRPRRRGGGAARRDPAAPAPSRARRTP